MSRSPDLNEVEPLGAADAPLLEELRAVLGRHDALERFGITLLHDHFDLDDGEQLLETCNPETRTLTIAPERIGSDASRIVETSWQFSREGEARAGLVCKVGCFVDLQDRHKRTHNRVNG
jgi:hypothetical protein